MYTQAFFCDKARTVARKLIGSTLVFNNQQALILETEAYEGLNDPASHAYKGITQRNALMFKKPGFAYIYLIYGRHLCLNVTTAPEGIPGSVFIRAVKWADQYFNGPGKLTKALGITIEDNGRNLCQDPLFYMAQGLVISKNDIIQSPRIGIKHGVDKPWRFLLEKHIGY